jgi:hydroxymethylpyrimidine/phosphomethylpyrimidine kinase
MTMALPTPHPVALSIAGSDSGAGAGVQADLLTFAAHQVFGTTAITCITAQNPDAVTDVHEVPVELVTRQAQAVRGFFHLRAIKTGMLFSRAIIEAVARFIAGARGVPTVVDPVMVATSGAVLLQPAAIDALARELLPLAALITPNLDEAAVLLGTRPGTVHEVEQSAAELSRRFKTAVLVKGGHLEGGHVVDVLAQPGAPLRHWYGERIEGVNTHGSGCTLSAAIAANLALGKSLEDAVDAARRYLRLGLEQPLSVGGRCFIAHGRTP